MNGLGPLNSGLSHPVPQLLHKGDDFKDTLNQFWLMSQIYKFMPSLPWSSREPWRAETGISDSDGNSLVQGRRYLHAHPEKESAKDI